MEGTARSSIRVASRQPSGPSLVEDIPVRAVRKNVDWVANKRFEISKFNFKFPRARTYEIIGLVLVPTLCDRSGPYCGRHRDRRLADAKSAGFAKRMGYIKN